MEEIILVHLSDRAGTVIWAKWCGAGCLRSLSHVRLFETPWTVACHVPLFSTISRVCWNSCSLSWCCYLTLSSFASPFSFCHQSFRASGSFPMSRPLTSDGWSIGTAASILPVNIQGWFPLGLTGLISAVQRILKESSQVPQFESSNSLMLSLRYGPTLTSVNDHWKTIALTRLTSQSRLD